MVFGARNAPVCVAKYGVHEDPTAFPARVGEHSPDSGVVIGSGWCTAVRGIRHSRELLPLCHYHRGPNDRRSALCTIPSR